MKNVSGSNRANSLAMSMRSSWYPSKSNSLASLMTYALWLYKFKPTEICFCRRKLQYLAVAAADCLANIDKMNTHARARKMNWNSYHCNSINCRYFIIQPSNTLFRIKVVNTASPIADGEILRMPFYFRLFGDLGESIWSNLFDNGFFEIVFGEICWIRPIVQIHVKVQCNRWIFPQFETFTVFLEYQFLPQKYSQNEKKKQMSCVMNEWRTTDLHLPKYIDINPSKIMSIKNRQWSPPLRLLSVRIFDSWNASCS